MDTLENLANLESTVWLWGPTRRNTEDAFGAQSVHLGHLGETGILEIRAIQDLQDYQDRLDIQENQVLVVLLEILEAVELRGFPAHRESPVVTLLFK